MLITKATIGPMPVKITDLTMPSVRVEYEDGSSEELFDYYPDELSFTESEFVGLTKEQAMRLRHDKDVSYLRS